MSLCPAYWGTHANREAKFLLLRFCFEELHLLRVQFRTDVEHPLKTVTGKNWARRWKALSEKSAFWKTAEHSRDAALYSILDTEWPEVKAALARDLITLEGVDLHPPFMGSTESSYSPLNAA